MHRRKKVVIIAILQNAKIFIGDIWVKTWIDVSVLQIMQLFPVKNFHLLSR